MVCHSSNTFRVHMTVTLKGLIAEITLYFFVPRVNQGLNNLFPSLLPVALLGSRSTHLCVHTIEPIAEKSRY